MAANGRRFAVAADRTKRVKVVNAVTRDSGGGGRAARRLHDGLLNAGVDSTFYVRGTAWQEASVREFRPSGAFADRVRRFIRRKQLMPKFRKIEECLGYESPWTIDCRVVVGMDPIRQFPAADVVNLHSLYNFLDLELFFSTVGAVKPVVWTLHDMVAFTGGCIYAGDCERFKTACSECPILAGAGLPDWSLDLWRRKAAAYGNIDPARFHIVTPSRWMAERVRASALLGRFATSVIPYGLDTEAYAPRDRAHCREVLGLPPDAKVALFVTQYDIRNTRKGFAELTEALRSFTDMEDLVLLTIGKGGEPKGLRHPVRHIGEVSNERLQSMIYSAADVYLIPSLEDNLPLVVQESMACGTPVAGFASGGIPEMVEDGVHGRLVETGDSKALAAALAELLDDDAARREMGRACRARAEAEFGLERQARAYREVYETLSH